MSLKTLLTGVFVCLLASAVRAQDADDSKAEIRLTRVEMSIEAQPTPQIMATNVKEKRWKPKNWLEVQVDFKAQIARSLGGREGVYPSIEVKYFLALAGKKNKEG